MVRLTLLGILVYLLTKEVRELLLRARTRAALAAVGRVRALDRPPDDPDPSGAAERVRRLRGGEGV